MDAKDASATTTPTWPAHSGSWISGHRLNARRRCAEMDRRMSRFSVGSQEYTMVADGSGGPYRVLDQTLPVAPVPTTLDPGPRVLVMDDEPTVGRTMLRLLSRALCDVKVVTRGEEAVAAHAAALAQGCPFDVSLLDLNVAEGWGGEETLVRMRKVDPTVMAVLCSGEDDPGRLTHWRQMGFFACLPKPFEGPALVELVRLATLRARQRLPVLAAG